MAKNGDFLPFFHAFSVLKLALLRQFFCENPAFLYLFLDGIFWAKNFSQGSKKKVGPLKRWAPPPRIFSTVDHRRTYLGGGIWNFCHAVWISSSLGIWSAKGSPGDNLMAQPPWSTSLTHYDIQASVHRCWRDFQLECTANVFWNGVSVNLMCSVFSYFFIMDCLNA